MQEVNQNEKDHNRGALSHFKIRIEGIAADPSPTISPSILFDALSRCVEGWEETEYDESESENDEESEEEFMVATGYLDLTFLMRPSVFSEYAAYDPDAFESLKVSIIYVNEFGTPVFRHVYECDPVVEFSQQTGSQDSEVTVVASLDYYSAEKFQAPTVLQTPT